jgi:hypothetical protein
MSKSFGPLYGGKLNYPTKKPLTPGFLFELGKTRETEQPYRKGRCLIFKLPASKTGFYFGLWVKNPHIDDEDHEAISAVLLDAMNVQKETKVTEWQEGDQLVFQEREVKEGLL